ncbi:MAG: DUF4032 domain-containing protein [Brevinematia bacterium]
MSPVYFDLEKQVSEVVEEIMKYKWLESEKVGRDIGMKEAATQWISKHYVLWFKATKDRFIKEV